jgi:excisionase family DNA binding protein
MSKLLTVQEVADFLGIHRITLYRALSQGLAPNHIRIGTTIRFRPEDVEAYIEANRVGSSSQNEAV